MFELPTSVWIEEKEYKIRKDGDYRMVLDCFSALQDIELGEEERIITALIIFYDDVLSLDNLYELFDTPELMREAVKEMYRFFNCYDERPGRVVPYKLIDWEQDTQIIAGAVNKVAGTEIRSVEYLHWWTFMGYYSNVGKSTLSTIVDIRKKIKEGKKLEKPEKEFRHDNPQFFIWNSATIEDQEAEEWARNIWNSEQ